MIKYTPRYRMPWGKYRGKKLSEIPNWYFQYIYKKFKWGTMKPMGEENIALRNYICDNNIL